jgi:DnaJ-class molecular chaperone
MEPDYYELLRVSKSATLTEIEHAFRREISRQPSSLWKRWWWAAVGRTPERLACAYETLSQPDRRARYDRYLAELCVWPHVFPH